MSTEHLEPESAAHEFGTAGVDNLVQNAERICSYEQQRIQLSNEGAILSLQAECNALLSEERRIETVLLAAPPTGSLRRLRLRAIFYWTLTALLTASGIAFTMVTLEPFRLGHLAWLFAGGLALLTPFLVDKLLERSEALSRVLNALATVSVVTSLMFFADVRGNLLEQQARQNQDQAVVIDDAPAPSEPENTFYDKSSRSLHLALLLLAFGMEVGGGLVLREAWRSAPDTSEDWGALRRDLLQIRRRKADMVRVIVGLRNEPGIFEARFWRDFYRAMLSKTVRSAMTRFLGILIGCALLSTPVTRAQDRVDMVIAVDLTQSVATKGPDGKGDFEKNIDGVSRVLGSVPAGSHVTVIGITDHSFTQPYILLSAETSGDPGYFGERLAQARSQLVRAWKAGALQLNPHFQHTDILGAFRLAGQIFEQSREANRKTLVIFSDMRQDTSELDLESMSVVPSFASLAKHCSPMPDLRGASVYMLGVDGTGKTVAYWESLNTFWEGYLFNSGAFFAGYSVLSDLSTSTIQ